MRRRGLALSLYIVQRSLTRLREYDLSYGRRQGGSYEGRRGHGKGFKRCPVEMEKEYEVDLTEMSRQEEGIARIQGLVIFVPNAKPGDHSARAENKNYSNRWYDRKRRSSQVVFSLKINSQQPYPRNSLFER